MKYILSLVISFCLLSFSVLSQGSLEVNWDNPSQYSDVKATMDTQSAYQKNVFNEIEKSLLNQIKDLPDSYVLTIKVSDLDIAGNVTSGLALGFGASNDVRIFKDSYVPRIKFSFVLKKDNALVKSGLVDLKDFDFLASSSKFGEPFAYEKNMMGKWTKEMLIPYI